MFFIKIIFWIDGSIIVGVEISNDFKSKFLNVITIPT
jgi:hypothetical protein